jgi:hypothetical protein
MRQVGCAPALSSTGIVSNAGALSSSAISKFTDTFLNVSSDVE